MIVRRGNGLGVLVYDPAVKKKVWIGTFRTEEEAQVAEVRAAAVFNVDGRGETCDAFARRWPEDFPRPSANTNESNRQRVKRFIRDWEGVPLVAATRARAYPWAKDQPEGTRDACRLMFTDAINAGLYVGENPFANLRLPRSRGRRDLTTLPAEEVLELADCAEFVFGEYGRLVYRPLIIFAALVACRPGELFCVERSDIHGDEVWITKSLAGRTVLKSDAITDDRAETKLPKNGDERRAILLPPVLEAIELIPPRLDVPWLFYTKTGRQFKTGNHWTYWSQVRAAYGRPDIAFYEMRHAGGSFFTNELDARPEDTAIQLGHTDGGELVRTLYGHPDERRARERLRDAFRSAFPEGTDGL